MTAAELDVGHDRPDQAIGLAIANRIIAEHGGSISLDIVGGTGTALTFPTIRA